MLTAVSSVPWTPRLGIHLGRIDPDPGGGEEEGGSEEPRTRGFRTPTGVGMDNSVFIRSVMSKFTPVDADAAYSNTGVDNLKLTLGITLHAYRCG